MRKSGLLNSLFPVTRQAVLATVLLGPDREWFLSDLARHVQVPPSSLQRELGRLVEAGILRRRIDGNRVYFSANPECPILPELQGILAKTVGLVDILCDALAPFENHIAVAFVYGSIARSMERSGSDIDLFIIGRLGLAELAEPLRQAEQRLGRPLNPMVYSQEEFAEKAREGHHFISTVLRQERLLIIGSENDLAAITGDR